jgi:hypothetical protein
MKTTFLLLFSVNFAIAQTPITGLTTITAYAAVTGSTYNATGGIAVPASGNLTGTTYTYDWGNVVATTNNYKRLDAFTTSLNTYTFQSITPTVVFRRVNNANATGLRKLIWFEETGTVLTSGTAGGTVSLLPAYDDSLERIFAERLFNVGIDNVFENGAETNDNNIERVDVLFPGGIEATDASMAGFAVFDRGTGLTHDAFQIAAIASLDGSGKPSGYYPAVTAVGGNGTTAGSFGNIGASTSLNYHMLRMDQGDPFLRVVIANQSQDRDGVFFTFASLGVPVRTKIYGYSVFATDVVSSPASNIVAYTNAAIFPTTTELGSSGGIDMVAVTGLAATSSSYVVLPLETQDFCAIPEGDAVRLSWQPGAVDGLGATVVERSGDGMHFSQLFTVSAPAAGEAALQTAVDRQPLTGTNYYRLYISDEQGHPLSYSPVAEVNFLGASSYCLYPNPVLNRRLTFQATGLNNGSYQIRLFGVKGAVVLQQRVTVSGPLKTDILLPPGLSAGVYLLQLLGETGKTLLTQALVVE